VRHCSFNAVQQRRTQATLADGSRWRYQYNDRDEVVSGKRFWVDWTPVGGQQFEYAYDNIGNRLVASSGGDAHGANLRSVGHTANALNQYTTITNPPYAPIVGVALATNSVAVCGSSNGVSRWGEYFHREITVTNAGGPVWTGVSVESGGFSTNGGLVCPAAQQTLSYDADGNLTGDGIWAYRWDGENRLVQMSMTNIAYLPAVQRKKLEFVYDFQGRRVQKVVWTWNGSAFGNPVTHKYLYDGWTVVAVLGLESSVLESFLWGQDLSGTLQGAGGIGGLVAVFEISNGEVLNVHFPCYDGNGNVMALVAPDGSIAARYEYGPFGEPIRASGSAAKANPFRWSTKLTDEESGLVYYGYRYYSPGLGRWISRDPAEETDGRNLQAYVANHAPNSVDGNGLAEHHVATMALANSLPNGPGTDYLKKFTVPVIDRHYYDHPHRAYNLAVRQFFDDWCAARGVTEVEFANSAKLAAEFVQDCLDQPRNSTIGAYLNKNMINGGRALKAAFLLGAAFAGYSAYAGGNELVVAAVEYRRSAAQGDAAAMDLDAVGAAIAVQNMTGDYFTTMYVLDALLP